MNNIFHFRKLQTTIVVYCSILLISVLLVLMALINYNLSTSVKAEIEKTIIAGSQLFNFLSDEYRQRLTDQAYILASDFAFRQAIATADTKTISSVLDNHRIRLNANIMILADMHHQTIIDSSGVTKLNEAFPFPELLNVAEKNGTATGTAVFGNYLYHIVIVPVLGPLPIAWLASAFIINDSSASKTKSLIGLDLSFLYQRSSGKLQILATNLFPAQSNALLKTLTDRGITPGDDLVQLNVEGEVFLVHIYSLVSNKDGSTIIVIQQSLTKALKPFYRLQRLVLIFGLIVLLVSLIFSRRLAQSISQPLQKLILLAERIRYGDYSKSFQLDREDEIGQLASVFYDMSMSIKDRETEIMTLANYDSLTGLPNRILFSDRLSQAIKIANHLGNKLVIMIIDLNRFKEVNDIMGHHMGDKLLQEISRRLQPIVIQEFDTLARLGGDEFALLLRMDIEAARIIADKIINLIDRPIKLFNKEVVITSSIGIACYPDHGQDIDTLLRYSELAMYAAKTSNKDYIVFDHNLNYLEPEHLSLIIELRRAISENELILYYQPKIDITTGTIGHAEALVRWIHPDRGLVPPSEFIPFAENNGFIKYITLWVLEQTLRQQKDLLASGISLIVSINISAHDLFIPKLSTILSNLFKKYEVSPSNLIFEITESAIMTNLGDALTVLDEIYELGVHLSVDDYGTGYSSLTYLKKLPISELKIDQSFIFNMKNDQADFHIVKSTIDLAHNMGLKVVAEGIEDAITSDMLASLGCDFLQGYFICKPLAIELMIDWAKQSSWKLNIIDCDENKIIT